MGKQFKRFVLYNETYGVYLGSFIGLGLWSKMDAGGQDMACTFASEEEIREEIENWETKPESWRAVEVEVDGLYASIADCEKAGLPGWKPEE